LLIRPIYYQILCAILLLSLPAGSRLNGQGEPPAAPSSGVELRPSENGLVLARAKESFSTLSLEGSDLQPRPPLSGGKGQTPEFARELLRLQWRPNDPIDLYVIRPLGVKNPPVVLYLYGFPSEMDRFRDDRYCGRLVMNGAAAVGFLSANTGYRAEHGALNKWFVSELPESLAMTVHDVQLILNYLATRGDLDMSRVGMFGQGSGGAIAILAAAADPRLKALDLLNPWGDWPDWLAKSGVVPKDERDRYVKPDFLKQVEPLDPVHYLPALKSPAIRIQFWDDENGGSKETVAKLESAAPANAKVIHYPNGRAMYAVSSNGRMFEWLANTLKSPAETKQATAKTPPAVSAR
jgi:acetyl esterase/lipase